MDYYPNANFGLTKAIELIKSNHHVFVDAYTFLFYIQNDFNISEETYILKEQVRKKVLKLQLFK